MFPSDTGMPGGLRDDDDSDGGHRRPWSSGTTAPEMDALAARGFLRLHGHAHADDSRPKRNTLNSAHITGATDPRGDRAQECRSLR